ncbi:hypothetical protein [Brevibacillus laterosporus]|uniref:hypothetical protein n=1 Tax=Brevibacillus laterosporus TaxID=1465 RepID=UPI0003B1A363|nr:hypothetical protein [Brevibacillus laterosporus]ERM20364.1 hypothetical protein P615_00220 [Brevibacillus laterosporus PE36]
MIINPVKDVVELLMYKGPEIKTLIQEAIKNGNDYQIKQTPSGGILLEIKTTTAYDLQIIDVYHYNADEELIYQSVVLNGNEKEIFNKYVEANNIIVELEKTKIVAS